MTFFSDNAADIIQLISLPLELVGFLLAFIEIRHPRTARIIEYKIDKWSLRLTLSLHGKYTFALYGKIKRFGFWNMIHVAYIIFFFASFIIIIKLANLHSDLPYFIRLIFAVFVVMLGLSIIIVPLLGIVALLILTVYIIIVFLSKAMSGIMSFLDTYSKGRALGSLGLILASLGAIGEVYQVIVLLFT